MAYTKRIVCLANSFKTGGSCVAGKELVNNAVGGWIRPVGDRSTGEVWNSESGNPKLLDIFDVPLLRVYPRHHQTENHVIDNSRPWMKIGELPWSDLAQMVDQPTSLWTNRDHTNGPGLYDCVSETEAYSATSSLALIKPDNLSIEVDRHYYNGRRIWRADFTYKGTNYNLSLTDPIATGRYVADGVYPLNGVYICVSLTEKFKDGRCHKLVAAIFANPPL